MEQIIKVLEQLLVEPKKATQKIDVLSHQEDDFMYNLASTIIDGNLNNALVKAGVTTFNVLAVRIFKNSQIKDFFNFQQVFSNTKRLLFTHSIAFKEKRLLLPCLQKFMAESSITYQEVMQLQKQAFHAESLDSMILILQAITQQDSKIPKQVKIQCLRFLVPHCSQTIFNQSLQCIDSKNYKKIIPISNIEYNQAYLTILCFLKTFRTICKNIFGIKDQIRAKDNIREYQIMQQIYNNEKIGKILLAIINWNYTEEESKQFNYIILEDLVEYGTKNTSSPITLLTYYQVNELKQISFEILDAILKKMKRQNNLNDSQFVILSNLPKLCSSVLGQLLRVGKNFRLLYEQFMIESLCDCMFEFLSTCVEFIDLIPTFLQIQEKQLCYLPIPFLQTRSFERQNFQMDPENFVSFVEGMITNVNLAIISKYSVSHFIQNCSVKIDYFAKYFFDICFFSMIKALSQRVKNKKLSQEDYYQQLVELQNTVPETLDNQYQVQCFFNGIIALIPQFNHRIDFKTNLKHFLRILAFQHLQPIEKIQIYQILKENIQVFLSASNISLAPKFISSVFEIDEEDQGLFLSGINFLQKFYHQYLMSLTYSPQNYQFLQSLVQKTIWQNILFKMKIVKNIIFWQALLTMIKPINKSKTSCQCQQLHFEQKIKNVLPQIFFQMLQICLQRQRKLTNYENHDETLWLKIHFVVEELYETLHQIVYIDKVISEQDTPSPQIMMEPYIKVIKIFFQPNKEDDFYLYDSQRKSFLSVLCKFIGWKYVIKSEIFQLLLPFMLAAPYGQEWLVCMCEFTHLTQAKFSLQQFQKICNIVIQGLQAIDLSEKKLNQLIIFSMVVLSHQQPQKWSHCHQLYRIKLIKSIKSYKSSKNSFQDNNNVMMGYVPKQITMIRLFNVYLYGFKLEPSQDLFEQIFEFIRLFTQRYTLIECCNLVQAFKSSYQYLDAINFKNLFHFIIDILKKLYMNSQNYQTKDTPMEIRLSKMGSNIKHLSNIDPFNQLKILLRQFQKDGITPTDDQFYIESLNSMLNIQTIEGKPRKVFKIKRMK